jgi:hypothetical protein
MDIVPPRAAAARVACEATLSHCDRGAATVAPTLREFLWWSSVLEIAGVAMKMKAWKRLGFAISLLVVLPLSSCVPQMSLQPWYSDKDLVLEPGFAGNWLLLDTDNKPEDSQAWQFVQNLDKGYTVSFEDPEQPGVIESWELRLFRVNGQLYADVVQLASKFKDTDLAENFIPGHMVGTVKLEADKISMRFLDDEWTAKAVKANGGLIKHETVGDSAVLTGSSAELREFALAHSGDDKAFSVDFNFVRKK